ncbi:hypothetical protein FGIG_00754 [Fasciola gigantica]|uniref:Fibronectin type-III domain-containing protein n=1 Tax=Fasciola gigantica TaxID=46835 RepID=A0A504ZBX2_FASGI|nr:hypothetical protein FGIG_00754 [Fasciola gigantica]
MPVLHEMEALDSSRIRVRWLAAPTGALIDWPNGTGVGVRPSVEQQFLVQWSPFPFTDWEEKRVRVFRPTSTVTPTGQVYELVIRGLLSRTAYRVRIVGIGSEGMGAALELGPLKTKGQGECKSLVNFKGHVCLSISVYPMAV